MTQAIALKVLAHGGIEALGGLGIGCMLLLCDHDHLRGRLAVVNRLAHSRAYRVLVIGLFYLATSAATVAVLDAEIFEEGLTLFALAVGLHLVLEGVGGASLMGLIALSRGGSRRQGLLPLSVVTRTKVGKGLLLGAWYLTVGLLAVLLIPLGH